MEMNLREKSKKKYFIAIAYPIFVSLGGGKIDIMFSKR